MEKIRLAGVTRRFAATRRYPEMEVLTPIDLAIGAGEFVAVVGPSGCGKSTLLRLIAGLDRPSGGSVLIDGQPVAGPSPRRGMVFQQAGLFPWLTVRGNVAFALTERGVPRAERRRIADGLIERVGLSGFAEHWPAALSGGMRQRCALARALAGEPEILLLDEPFGALDRQTRGLMQEMLLDLWEADRKTVVLVTHDIEEAVFLAGRVVALTARPARIKLELAVDLPRPRPYTIRTDPAFTRLEARLVEELRADALEAASQGVD